MHYNVVANKKIGLLSINKKSQIFLLVVDIDLMNEINLCGGISRIVLFDDIMH